MNSNKFSNVDKLIFGLNFLNLTKFNVNICLIIIIKFVHIYWYNTVMCLGYEDVTDKKRERNN